MNLSSDLQGHSVYSFHRIATNHASYFSNQRISKVLQGKKIRGGNAKYFVLSWKEGEYIYLTNHEFKKSTSEHKHLLPLEPMLEACICTKQSYSSDSSVMNALVKWDHWNSPKWFYSCWDGKNFIHGIHWKGANIFCSFLYSSQTIPLFTMISSQTKRLTVIAEATRIMAKVKCITGILFCPACSSTFVIMLIGNKTRTGTQLETLFWFEDMVHMDTHRKV